MKNIFSFLMRLGLSGVLLFWILRKIDWNKTLDAMKTADVGFLSLAAFVFVLVNFVILGRWMIFIKALELHLPAADVVKWFFIGLFCNLFLPTSIGGDVVKVIGLCKASPQKPKVFASVVLDRLSGFAGIVLTAAIVFIFGYRLIPDKSILISIVALTLLSAVIVVVLFNEKFYALACRMFVSRPKVKDTLTKIHHNLSLLKNKPQPGYWAIGLSVLTQVILALIFYLTARALNQNINFF